MLEKVVIVDDEPQIVRLASRILKQHNFETYEFTSPGEALEFLNQNEVDLLITDLRMPEMKGIELIDEFSRIQPDVPVIVISGYADMDSVIEAMRLGAASFIVKPFSSEELIENVENVLELSRLKSENIKLRALIQLFDYIKEFSGPPTINEALFIFKRRLDSIFEDDLVEFYVLHEKAYQVKELTEEPLLDEEHINLVVKKAIDAGGKLFVFSLSEFRRDTDYGQAMVFHVTSNQKPAFSVMISRQQEKGGFSENEKMIFGILCSQLEAVYNSKIYAEDLEVAYIELVESLAAALEARDEYTGEHSSEVPEIAVQIAEKLGLDNQTKDMLILAAKLHDVGKIAVPDSILLKPGKLTEEEFETIKKHPVIGFNILSVSKRLSEVAKIVLHHHEWFSGGGYPDGLKNGQIPLLSRILCLADAYHALTSDRPYRKALSPEKALEIIKSETPKKYDPELVKLLEEIITSRISYDQGKNRW